MGKWIDEIDNPRYWSEEPKHCINCTCYINYQDGTGWCTTFDRKIFALTILITGKIYRKMNN